MIGHFSRRDAKKSGRLIGAAEGPAYPRIKSGVRRVDSILLVRPSLGEGGRKVQTKFDYSFGLRRLKPLVSDAAATCAVGAGGAASSAISFS